MERDRKADCFMIRQETRAGRVAWAYQKSYIGLLTYTTFTFPKVHKQLGYLLKRYRGLSQPRWVSICS